MTAALKMPTPTEAALQLLTSQGFVQYHPILADRLGSFKAALFLGHALYWARHVQSNFQSREGWFFLSAKQCTEATGLSAREQASARQLLIEHSLLTEMLSGRPAKLHYKVDLSQLAQFLGMSVVEHSPSQAPTWQQLLPLFKGCINFYRPLATIAGNVASGLYLSYLLNQHRHFMTYPRQGAGFTVSQSALRSALCLGPKTQRNARDRLKQIGLLIEHGNLLQINLQALAALLQGQKSKPLRQSRKAASKADQAAAHLELVKPAQLPEPAINSSRLFKPAAISQKQLFGLHPVNAAQSTPQLEHIAAVQAQIVTALRNPGFKAGRLFGHLAEKSQPQATIPLSAVCQTGAQTAKLESPSAENANLPDQTAKLTGPNRKTKLPKTQNIKTTSIKQTTTSTSPATVDNFKSGDSSEVVCRRSFSKTSSSEGTAAIDELHMEMPGVLPERWHTAVRQVLSNAQPGHRQSLLDELEGQLSNPAKKIHNPPGYLHSLRVAMECGSADLAHADAVAAERRERKRLDSVIKNHQRQQAEVSAAAPTLSRNEARAQLKLKADQWKAELALRGLR